MGMHYSPPPITCILGTLVAGVVIALLPDVLARPLLTTLRDVIVPGRSMVTEGWAWLRRGESPAGGSPLREDESAGPQSEAVTSRLRALELEVARWRELARSQRIVASTSPDEPSSPEDRLIQATAIPARLLGEFSSSFWRKQGVLGIGKQQDLTESALVLNTTQPMLDVGMNFGVQSQELVRTGQAVIGRIVEVGRWSSLVRPVTDRDFRAAARLARRTEQGLVFASEGVLQGTGEEHCTLRLITPTEPVAPGDLVVTVERDTGVAVPLVYGEVTVAELPDNALEWTIQVQPAARWESAQDVCVVRLKVNHRHPLAN